jgi:mono/diheme cytochrome c family protein
MRHVRILTSLAAGSLLLGTTALAEVDKKAERTWKSKCASCHGPAGRADTEKGKELKIVDMSTPAFQAKKDEELKRAILEGVEKEKSHSFKSELTPEQVDGLVAYVRTFKK